MNFFRRYSEASKGKPQLWAFTIPLLMLERTSKKGRGKKLI